MMDCLNTFLAKWKLEHILQSLNDQKFNTLEDLKLLVKYPFYVEKIGLPGFEALKLLDALTTHFKGSGEISTSIAEALTPSSHNINTTAPTTQSSPSNSMLKKRIMKKRDLLKIKSFVAQEANTVWNEFNQAISALVNERIDEFQGTKSLRCNYGTTADHAFQNNTIVTGITKHPSLKSFMERRFDIPGHGYVSFDAKLVRIFCGNKLTHLRKKKSTQNSGFPSTKRQLFAASEENKGDKSTSIEREQGQQVLTDLGDKISPCGEREEHPRDSSSSEEEEGTPISKVLHDLADRRSQCGNGEEETDRSEQELPCTSKEATLVVLKFFDAKTLTSINGVRLKHAVREAGLEPLKELKTKTKEQLAELLGFHLYKNKKVIKVKSDRGISLRNLKVA